MSRNKFYKIFLGIFSFVLLFGLHFFQNLNVFASTNPCGGTTICNYEYSNTSCSQSGPMTSSTSSGQSSISYSPGSGSYNSYNVNVSNTAPQLHVSYPENCDTYGVYCTGYGTFYGYTVCNSTTDGPSSYSTKTFTDTVNCPTTYSNSWNGVNDSASCGSGTIYFSTSPTSSAYLNGLVSNVQESCPGSYSYPVSVNNSAVKNYNDNTSGSALSGVSFSAYTSGGNLCGSASAQTVYPDLEDSTVTATLTQGFQAGPSNNSTEAQYYYVSTSCPGGWVECSNTNVNGTFNMVPLPNNSVNSNQLLYITSNTNGTQSPLNSATLNCSIEGNSSTFYLVVDDSAVKQHPQGYAPESPMNVSPIGYIINSVGCNTSQVHFSTSPGTPNSNDSDESVASCPVTGMVQLCATPDLDQNPYGLILQASSNLPFNTEQYGGNPLGEIVYTIYTQCQNSQGVSVNPNDCQNNNLDGYWGLNASGGNWLQLYAVSHGNSAPAPGTLYIYCNNNNKHVNGLYPFDPGPHSNSIGIDCQSSSTNNPVIDCVHYECFYAQAETQNQTLPSNVSYSEEISISNYNNIVSSSTRSCGGNGIKNDNLTDYLNIYAPWIWTYGGNSYSNNGYNITIPPTINTGSLPNYNDCSFNGLAADNEYPNHNGSVISADAIPGINSPAGDFNNAVLEQSSSNNTFENGSGTSSNLSYSGGIGTTNSDSTPVYNFNFYVTLYCEISGQCNNPQLYNTDGSINLSKINSTISSVSNITSSSSSSDWYFYQGNMSINSSSGYSYAGNGILLVNGNVDITPPLYPSNCSFSVSNPYASIQSCYGLVIIASGNITIENSNPNTTGDNILNEDGTLHSSGSGYDVIDAFLVSMSNIIVE